MHIEGGCACCVHQVVEVGAWRSGIRARTCCMGSVYAVGPEVQELQAGLNVVMIDSDLHASRIVVLTFIPASLYTRAQRCEVCLVTLGVGIARVRPPEGVWGRAGGSVAPRCGLLGSVWPLQL